MRVRKMEKIYKAKRFVDRLKWVIVNENGKVQMTSLELNLTLKV